MYLSSCHTKDNKLEAVYSGGTLLVAYTYDGDGTITSSLDRDLDLNQNLNTNDRSYINRLTQNQRQLINKVLPSDSFLYEFTEYVLDRNRPYVETLMERDGAGNLSTLYTYGNQRINSESYNNLSGLYTYDGRGSVSAVLGSWGDFRATYWYDGLGNVKNQIHGYGAFGSGKKYYGYNAEQYNPVTGNQNLRARQLNIRRQRFLSEDIFIGNNNNPITLNRYIYANDNPLKYKDPSGYDTFGIGINVSASMIGNSGITIGMLRSDSLRGWQAFISPQIGIEASPGASVTGVIFKDSEDIKNEKTSSKNIEVTGGEVLVGGYSRMYDDKLNNTTAWSVSFGAGVGAPASIKGTESWLIIPNYDKAKKKVEKPFFPDTSLVSPSGTFIEIKKESILDKIKNLIVPNKLKCGAEP